jgi:hypothetical protein
MNEHQVAQRLPLPDEPTRLERLITAQFTRGVAVPLSPREQQDLIRMNLAQRCDHVAKLCVWTARAIEKRILETEPSNAT